ncbi:MAG: hypothetical protein P4L33_03150 [Capsulimonadaceae bacterium]|nr:hypothetical protein [Capsulimonadaceae bacterium]
MSDQLFKTVIGVIVAFALLIGGLALWHSKQASHVSTLSSPMKAAQEPNPAPRKPTQPLATLSVGVGRSGILRNGNDQVDVAVNQGALIELANAARVQSTKRYYAVFDKGRAFRVGDGTAIRVIGEGIYSGHVRILSGASAGKTGYVPQEWVCER